MKRLIYLLAAVAFTACGSATSLSVMTFNMRYDNPEDGQNNWRFRRERIAGVIKAQEVDVLGTQELLSNQFNDLSGLLTGYQGVGVGRLDGAESGEYCAVFFRKDRFTLLDSGTFWLSETPEVVGSLGWDGACERIATWVVLRDRDGRELFFIDTHLDHVGQVARDEGVSLLMKRIETLSGGRPVILTGDFNSEPGSSVVAHVQKDGVLRDAKAIAAQENQIKSIEAEIKRKEEEARKKAEEEKKEAAAANKAAQTYKTVSLGDISFTWPCPASGRITSGFGGRKSPTKGASSNHQGIDISAPTGTSIVAAAAGEVVIATYSSSAGNYVMISHGGGVYTVYMHASSLLVSQGQSVKKGQTIAKVGSTGYSTGSHLHFGVRVNGSYVNPTKYVSP